MTGQSQFCEGGPCPNLRSDEVEARVLENIIEEINLIEMRYLTSYVAPLYIRNKERFVE